MEIEYIKELNFFKKDVEEDKMFNKLLETISTPEGLEKMIYAMDRNMKDIQDIIGD